MIKIRKVRFIDHPVLKNLELDFCDENGNAADTILIAGENGAGKSTILNELYSLSSLCFRHTIWLEIEVDGKRSTLLYYPQKVNNTTDYRVKVNDQHDWHVGNTNYNSEFPLHGIFSDVDINFQTENVRNVTSLTLDSSRENRRSDTNLPKTINQLLVDVQALDDADLARAAREHADIPACQLGVAQRMPRFTEAFNQMFSDLKYSHITNRGGNKAIIFKKNGIEIPIEKLSSGEKQIVYRGCFLLKDINAINGALVFIDEPEISLHPTWQKKIMDYYKGIFTDPSGVQTSQIFAVTHSPFVIHNENRKADKVIVLCRNVDGDICVSDKPEYYRCDTVSAIEDAFSIRDFSPEKPTVYLEGRTDEKYFNKALEAYDLDVPFVFRWVGHFDASGQEANTGKDALGKAVQFLMGRNLPVKSVCLFDCDTHRTAKEELNVVTMAIPQYENSKHITVGIENALVLDGVDIEPFRTYRTVTDPYGMEKSTPEFHKMECCDYICSLDKETLKTVFANLKTVIDNLVAIFNGEQPQ